MQKVGINKTKAVLTESKSAAAVSKSNCLLCVVSTQATLPPIKPLVAATLSNVSTTIILTNQQII